MHPYPIYFDKRPVKVVFLVNISSLSKKIFSRILHFNTGLYNGRNNPIVLTSNGTLAKTALDFLKDYDPDVIKLLFKPKKKLLEQIQYFLSPYSVQIVDLKSHIGGFDDSIRINRPTDEIVSQLRQFSLDNREPFVMFKTKELKDKDLKYFLETNFGVYEDFMVDQFAKDMSNPKICEVKTNKDSNEALKEISEVHKSFFFPIQLSSLPNHGKDVDYHSDNENFTVVIGDSPHDLAYFWNRNLSVSHWLRTSISQILISPKLANKKSYQEGLQLLIRKQTSRIGNNNNGKYVRFVSFSLKEKELKEIANILGEKTWAGKRVVVHGKEQIFPNYGRNKDFFSIKQGMDLYQAYGKEENVVINEPVLPKGMNGGNWMLDVYIQYRPERYQYTNVRHWWRLPQRNELTRQFFTQKVARVQKNGIPSVLMETKSLFKPDESNLTIKIPDDDEDIIRSYLYGEDRPVYTGDPRSGINKKNKHFYSEKSDKGGYLYGLINLFDGLFHGNYTLREKYWKDVFELMSNSDPLSDEKAKTAVFNKLKNKLKSIPQNKDERDSEIEWLSEHILDLSKNYSKSDNELSFEQLAKIKIDEINSEYKKQQKKKLSQSQVDDYKKTLKRDIKGLVEDNVLLMGVKPHCSYCGYANWYQVDEIKQKPECRGCKNTFNLPPEITWLYRLSNLVRDGIRQHGLVPVLLTLGQLYEDSRSSFIYTESLDLYKLGKKNKYTHLGDLDIVCIQDGRFVMGEVKRSSSLFKQKHFDDALSLAKQIRPDCLIFSSLDGQKRKLIEDNIKQLQNELKPFGVEVVWYQLHKFAVIY